MTRLTVTKLNHLSSLVIKQLEGKDFFISTPDSIVISINSLAFILKFLIENDFMSYKVLEGILEEYHSTKGA